MSNKIKGWWEAGDEPDYPPELKASIARGAKLDQEAAEATALENKSLKLQAKQFGGTPKQKILKKQRPVEMVPVAGPKGKTLMVPATDDDARACGMEPPASVRCRDGHRCCLAAGHGTPHRTICGNRWTNKRKQ